MTTETPLAKLYRDACRDDARLLADVDVADLIDLAQGRLAGERRARLVGAMASSPALADAYRLAKAGGEWSQALAGDLSRETGGIATVRRQPLFARGHSRPAARRYPLALAAAVGAMAVGAVFFAQRMQTQAPSGVDGDFASVAAMHGDVDDTIAAGSFEGFTHASPGGEDVIFTTRDAGSDSDRIFSYGRRS